MANGQVPGDGRYGDDLSRAVVYVIRQQKPGGLIARVAPSANYLDRNIRHSVGWTITYNHAIASLSLSEAYATCGDHGKGQMADCIEAALEATLKMQRWPKSQADAGGWRYLSTHDQLDCDLSITGWQLMFLRSAKNAGFKSSSNLSMMR